LAIVAADLLAVGYGPETRQGAIAYRWLRQSLRFLSAAFDPSGAMHNQLSYHGIWEDWPHRGDHVGRAMWGLGVMAGTAAVPEEVSVPAGELLDELARTAGELSKLGLRSVGYALLGLARAGRAEAAAPLVEVLDRALRETTAEDPSWTWFEPELTYDNARLPQALLAGARLVNNSSAADRAIAALDWYADHVTTPEQVLRCVGNVWHQRGEDPAHWQGEDGDEQPIDAGSYAEAFAEAWLYRGNRADATRATQGLAWFLGANRANARLYVHRTGACHDGLSRTGTNANQGAESTLAYYQALFSLVRNGLAVVEEVAGEPGSTFSAGGAGAGFGRTLASRATTLRSNAVERSSGPRVRPPTVNPTGHRPRTSEGHTDAR